MLLPLGGLFYITLNFHQLVNRDRRDHVEKITEKPGGSPTYNNDNLT